MKKLFTIYIPLLAVALSSLLLFTSMDDKIFDLFLRSIPSLTEDPSVLVVSINDDSVEKVGLFPWPRDIMADGIVFLREMGASRVTFDLSYLDKSPMQVDPHYLERVWPQHLDNNFHRINSNISQILDQISMGLITANELPAYGDYLVEQNLEVKQALQRSVSHVTRDTDAYFGRTLNFFEDSYLTLSMITPEDVGDVNADLSAFHHPWLQDLALENIQGEKDNLTENQLAIIPAIWELQKNARGAGFVNAPVDRDGYRRRIDLLHRYEDRYYGQLALVPLLDHLGSPKIIVTNRHITLMGAQLDGETQDITIPRSQDGSVLIRWPQKKFQEYNRISAWDLIAYNKIEKNFIDDLTIMKDAGFFYYWDGEISPLEIYDQCVYIRESLSDEVTLDPVTIEDYREYKKYFLSEIDSFLNGNTEEVILAEVPPNDQELRDYVTQSFAQAREQLQSMMILRETVAEKAEGAFCFIGVDITSGTDVGLTTFQERFPNVGIHPTIANMILAQEFLDDSPGYISILLALILALGLAYIMNRKEIQPALIIGVISLVATLGLLLLYFIIFKQFLGVIVPLISMVLTIASLSVLRFLETIREKAFLKSAFSRYLSPEVISEIVDDPTKLNLGGEKREMTAIFTDIRGFSTIAEQLDPTDLVKLLNIYLSTMSDIVMDNKGTIDKYEGDAIIAFFGAPLYHPNHAELACRTALMMKKAEVLLNQRIVEEDLSREPLFTRIGINTGDMIVGNMGTANKMDYTIMGNSVNLAARLEGINKQYNTHGILISEHTKEQISHDFLLRRLDQVRVMGVNTPLRLYELLDMKNGSDHRLVPHLEAWDKAMEFYEGGDFSQAHDLFEKIEKDYPEDGVCSIFSKRCIEYMMQPPEDDWGGVFNLTKK